MKGFKSTGKGPKYGSFGFPSKAGFGPSSGSVKQVSSYTRRAAKRPVKKAIGGLAKNDPHNVGWNDFNRGGPVSDEAMALSKSAAARNLKATRK